MSEALPVCWATDQQEMYGQAFGYTRANRALRAATFANGAVSDPQARVVVHFTYPLVYRPIPGRFNVLFTMYESPQLPNFFSRRFRDADAILAPARWVADIFAAHTDRPVRTVPLGCYVEHFKGVDRDPPHPRPFRVPGTDTVLGPSFIWLFVGAHNMRKGWKHVLWAWANSGMILDERLLLYMKVTPDPRTDDPERVDGVQVRRNIVTDWRVVNDDVLHHLYAQADAFVFPTMGEGFGLTLLEAMATALPCVTTLATGITEFADERTVIPLRYEIEQALFKEVGEPDHWQDSCNVFGDDLIRKMGWVMQHWKKAQKMGLRAWNQAQSYSWDAAGQKMVATLRELACL